MDSRFQIFGAKTTPDIRSGFLGIVIGPETILPDMSGGPTDFREDCCMPLSGHLNQSMNEGSRAMTMFFLKK